MSDIWALYESFPGDAPERCRVKVSGPFDTKEEAERGVSYKALAYRAVQVPLETFKQRMSA